MRQFYVKYRDADGKPRETKVEAVSTVQAKCKVLDRFNDRVTILDVYEDGPAELKALLRF